MTQATKQIKILLLPDDHDQVRIAAAMQRTTMAGFCRDLVVAESGRVTEKLGLQAEKKAGKRASDEGNKADLHHEEDKT